VIKPRPPSIDHGVASFLWAFGLGVYVWLFLIYGVGTEGVTAFIFALLSAFAIFFFVRILGEERLRR
jgi:hypothetical protein